MTKTEKTIKAAELEEQEAATDELAEKGAAESAAEKKTAASKAAENEAEKDKAVGKETAAPRKPRRFKKEQLLVSKAFSQEERYFLDAILNDEDSYTIQEARQKLQEELARKPKGALK